MVGKPPRKWVKAREGVTGVRFFLLQLPIVASMESIPFADGDRKILIFKDENLAKDCVLYLESLTTPTEQAILKQLGCSGLPAVATMTQASWDRFQQEQVGGWVDCETLDAFKAACKSLKRRAFGLGG